MWRTQDTGNCWILLAGASIPHQLAPRRLNFLLTVKADLAASHCFIDAGPSMQFARRDVLEALTGKDRCPTKLEVTGLEIFMSPAT